MTDNLSELPASRRENADADNGLTINARLARLCYILVCLHVLFFGYLIVAHPRIHYSLTAEDGWVENLTAVTFLLAGVALFIAAFTKRRLFQSGAYILGGAALTLFAGEEISWGQRIIGFDTPDFLLNWNYQGEFNLHNTREYDVVFSNPGQVLFALCIAACAAFFCRKDRIFGFPAPSLMLILSLLVVMSFTLSRNASDFSTNFLPLILTWHRGLLLLLLLFALFSRNVRFFVAVAAAMALALVTSYLSYHNRHISLWELIEYLFSVIAFFYALAALLDQEAARQKIAAAVVALKSAVELHFTHMKFLRQIRCKFSVGIKYGSLTSWIAVCALIIAGSIGLAFMAYFDVRADASSLKDTLRSLRTAEPTARSNFDVYIDGRDLYYFKQPCANADVEATFFLAVFPENIDDLPVERRQHGFANLDFRFASKAKADASIVDDACAAHVKLPAYEIARISTGQHIVEDDGAITNLWIVEFPVGGE